MGRYMNPLPCLRTVPIRDGENVRLVVINPGAEAELPDDQVADIVARGKLERVEAAVAGEPTRKTRAARKPPTTPEEG